MDDDTMKGLPDLEEVLDTAVRDGIVPCPSGRPHDGTELIPAFRARGWDRRDSTDDGR